MTGFDMVFVRDLLGRSLQLTERNLANEGCAPDPEVKQLHDDLIAWHEANPEPKPFCETDPEPDPDIRKWNRIHGR